MSRRYHSTGCGTPHIIAPGYRYQSDPNARLETSEPFDHRKGTIRGFFAVCLVVLVVWFAISAFSSPQPRRHAPSVASPTTGSVEAAAGNREIHR